MNKVSNFIVGAPKCGTSSIYEMFKLDDRLGVTSTKETHFFSKETVSNSYYKVNPVRTLSDYHAEFDDNKEVYIDVCPSYLSSSEAVESIYNYNENANIIVILRNPVARALSHYLMDVKLGVNNRCFLDSLEIEMYKKEYVGEGLYSKWISNYIEKFSSDNVHVFHFEDLIDTASNELNRLYSLIISPPDGFFMPMENGFAQPRSLALARVRRLISGLPVNNYINAGLKRIVREKIFEKKADKPLFEKEKKHLEEIFKEEELRMCNLNPNFKKRWF